MGVFFEPRDFPTIEDATTLIDDAEALAMLSAPCLRAELAAESFEFKATRAILRAAILRWSDAGDGAVSQQSAGIFSMTTTPQARRNSFWPSEITSLQKICRGDNAGKAHGVDTLPGGRGWHSSICDLNFGGADCSCAANLTGGNGPLYELDPDDL